MSGSSVCITGPALAGRLLCSRQAAKLLPGLTYPRVCGLDRLTPGDLQPQPHHQQAAGGPAPRRLADNRMVPASMSVLHSAISLDADTRSVTRRRRAPCTLVASRPTLGLGRAITEPDARPGGRPLVETILTGSRQRSRAGSVLDAVVANPSRASADGGGVHAWEPASSRALSSC